MTAIFCPLASGSSGNSIFISSKYTNILIDAGLSGKKLQQNLHSIGIEIENIDAIFITHEHEDHIRGVGILSKKYNIPIYATEGTFTVMKHLISPFNINYIYSGENCFFNDICIKPFDIPHDAVQPVGYCVYIGCYKFTVVTDIGHVTDSIKQNIFNSDILFLESNHDVEMLKKGKYPFYLKKRILGDKGHISNEQAGNLLIETISSKLKHIFLGHLSKDNNTPELAFDTVKNILCANNMKSLSNLYLASPYINSKLIEL